MLGVQAFNLSLHSAQVKGIPGAQRYIYFWYIQINAVLDMYYTLHPLCFVVAMVLYTAYKKLGIFDFGAKFFEYIIISRNCWIML